MTEKIKLNDLLDPETFKKHEKDFAVFFENGGTWQELFQFDDNVMEAQYKVGYDLYEAKNYKDAADVFSYLITLNPYKYTYWMGMAGSRQGLNQFGEAIFGYSMAEAIDPAQPLPLLQMAECFEALGEKALAKENALKAITVAGANPQFRGVERAAEFVYNRVKS